MFTGISAIGRCDLTFRFWFLAWALYVSITYPLGLYNPFRGVDLFDLTAPLAVFREHGVHVEARFPSWRTSQTCRPAAKNGRDPRQNPRARGGGELFVDVPRIPDTRRLYHDDLGFFVGSRAMLYTVGHDDKFARFQLDNPLPELDPKAATPDQKHFVHVIVGCHGNVPCTLTS